MTRENKLALVVGFGLILLVGVLVSDHFSTASSQQSAEFGSRADDPLRRLGPDQSFITTSAAITSAPRSGQEPQALEPSESSSPAAASADAATAAPPTIHRPRQSSPLPQVDKPIEMGTPINPRVPQGLSSEPAPQVADVNIRHHHVVAGESMTSIARQYYGTGEVVDALAAFNNIDDPDRLSVNRRLRIPPLSVLRGGAPVETAPPATTTQEPARAQPVPLRTPPPAPTRTYTVRNGDVLSRIAARELGSARHANALFEANRHILRDMNDLRPGMVLTLPDISS